MSKVKTAIAVAELVPGYASETFEATKRGAGRIKGIGQDLRKGYVRSAAKKTGQHLVETTKDSFGISLNVAKKAADVFLNPASADALLNELLSTMLNLRTAYQYAHWHAGSYARHLLFERLYTSMDEDIDTLAELSLSEPSVKLRRSTNSIPEHVLDQWSQDPRSGEMVVLSYAEELLSDLPNLALDHNAFENFLQGLIQNRRRALYLLRLS
jgi:hypothetical protein